MNVVANTDHKWICKIEWINKVNTGTFGEDIICLATQNDKLKLNTFGDKVCELFSLLIKCILCMSRVLFSPSILPVFVTGMTSKATCIYLLHLTIVIALELTSVALYN